jgi:cellobiose phosphorylase
MLSNRFGHFDTTGSAFTITDPATPMPWVNVICNGRYGLVVSQNGGGFS